MTPPTAAAAATGLQQQQQHQIATSTGLQRALPVPVALRRRYAEFQR